ncbi:MAG: hypothetical protein ACREX0_13035 [Noviherbaspirillum sp.]
MQQLAGGKAGHGGTEIIRGGILQRSGFASGKYSARKPEGAVVRGVNPMPKLVVSIMVPYTYLP